MNLTKVRLSNSHYLHFFYFLKATFDINIDLIIQKSTLTLAISDFEFEMFGDIYPAVETRHIMKIRIVNEDYSIIRGRFPITFAFLWIATVSSSLTPNSPSR